MWQAVATEVAGAGGKIHLGRRVVGFETEGARVVAAVVEDEGSGRQERVRGDYFLSTMPVRELVGALGARVPAEIRDIAGGLVYRDFLTVGVLLRRLRLPDRRPILDNWIYVQEPDVKVGRVQIFNNWSPWMVRDPATFWVGLEYFCAEGDELWSLADPALASLAVAELERLGIASREDVADTVVVRVPKAYPAYLGTYARFDVLRAWVDRFENLFLLGRNGMHRYNNQDHSMLTAMTAVDNVAAGLTGKDNIWAVNTETEYHEERP
jgi:protoporphyrinogen oxidase